MRDPSNALLEGRGRRGDALKGEESSLLLVRKLHLVMKRIFSCIWCYLISPKHKYILSVTKRLF